MLPLLASLLLLTFSQPAAKPATEPAEPQWYLIWVLNIETTTEQSYRRVALDIEIQNDNDTELRMSPSNLRHLVEQISWRDADDQPWYLSFFEPRSHVSFRSELYEGTLFIPPHANRVFKYVPFSLESSFSKADANVKPTPKQQIPESLSYTVAHDPHLLSYALPREGAGWVSDTTPRHFRGRGRVGFGIADQPDLPIARGTVQARRLGEEQSRMRVRQNRIRTELSDQLPADPPWARTWAGSYVGRSAMTGYSILLAPNSGFAYSKSGCFGVEDLNLGDILGETEIGLRLRPVIDPSLDPDHAISETLYFVRWGERRYLVPKRMIPRFCINFRRSRESADQMLGIPLNEEDAEKPTQGLPQLPPAYMPLLKGGPLSMKITAVTEPRRERSDDHDVYSSRITLDKGSAESVCEGMDLRLIRGPLAMFVITSTQEHESEAEFVMSTRHGRDPLLPKVGDEAVWGE